MSYVNGLQFAKRRPAVRHVTPEEAIITANRIVDEANAKIARAVAFGEQWQQVAAELYEENERLRARVAELEKQLRRAKPKAGKRRWQDDSDATD